MTEKPLYATTSKMFAFSAGFMLDSLEVMLPWLIVMFSVILCDLVTGCRKSLLMGDPVRFSRAIRATMGKAVTYFSFVVMVVFINKASNSYNNLDELAILLICFIEFCSIISNILKPKGYNVNVIAALSVFCKKVFSIDKEDTKEIITKKNEQRTKK